MSELVASVRCGQQGETLEPARHRRGADVSSKSSGGAGAVGVGGYPPYRCVGTVFFRDGGGVEFGDGAPRAKSGLALKVNRARVFGDSRPQDTPRVAYADTRKAKSADEAGSRAPRQRQPQTSFDRASSETHQGPMLARPEAKNEGGNEYHDRRSSDLKTTHSPPRAVQQRL